MQIRLIIGSNNLIDLDLSPTMRVPDFVGFFSNTFRIKMLGAMVCNKIKQFEMNQIVGEVFYPNCTAIAICKSADGWNSGPQSQWAIIPSNQMRDIPLVMTEDDFDLLESATYGDLSEAIRSNNPEDPLSMDEFLPEDIVFVLPCGHVIMKNEDSIQLLTSIRANCPTCGERITPENTNDNAFEETGDLSSDDEN